MFLEIVRSPGLAHLSYIVGDGTQAAVIDPRQDCAVYLDIAYAQGAQITHIFETHRNEDFVIGSQELARRTSAAVYHGHSFPFGYGNPVRENDTFELEGAALQVLETPGHTDESISLVLRDNHFGESAVGVFTGDTLFIGDVGRTDFFPDRLEEMAGKLYDSIFDKLLPLGDQTILYPAHGAGSVCGSGMAAREFSTLGYERRYNPALQRDRSAFIGHKVNEHHYLPPYFRRMEELNQHGAGALATCLNPPPLSVEQFAHAMGKGMIVLDLRDPEAVAGARIPGSLAIPLSLLSSFVGWYLPYDQPIGLVAHDRSAVQEAARQLLRLGYEDIAGYLQDGMHSWEISGRSYDTIPAVHADTLKARIDQGIDYTLLDVRSRDEVEQGHLPDSTAIYAGELAKHIQALPNNRPVTAFCGSGQRAIIAASVLRQNGIDDVEVCLGSMAACRNIGCPVVEA